MKIILLFLPLLGACSDKALCKQTCDKLYSEDECHIQRPGHSDQSSLIDRCRDECTDALGERGGEAGDYNPFERTSGSGATELENNIQAQLWMDCIESKSCEELVEGYCAPIW